ncbi:MAG: ATP-binding cassette domain-containing protein, partial [Microvirga sp.]
MQPIIAISKLSKTYASGFEALKGIDLSIRPGEIFALLGPNGAGKTTLFNACSGIVKPTSGDVFLDGRRLTRLSKARRAQVGLGRTFQIPELFDSLTVRENAQLGREAGLAASSPLSQMRMRRSESADLRAAVDEAL